MEFKEFVYKHILNYISNNKDIDEEFFMLIIEYFLNIHNLNGYLLSVQFKKHHGYDLATYIPEYKVMDIYACSLNDVIDDYTKYFEGKLNNFEEELFSYLIVVRELVHELTHIYQCNIIRKAEKTLEEELLSFESFHLHNMDIDMLKRLNINININNYTRKVNKFIKKYYDSLLCERLAEYYSIDFTRGLIDDECICLKEFYNECFIDNLLKGYEEENGILISPTYRVYKGIHKLIGVSSFDYEYLHSDYEITKDKVKCLKFDTRVKLGLPITNEEFNNLL